MLEANKENNNINTKENIKHVKFISYTDECSECSNLCEGMLTLEIDGEVYKFGHNYFYYDESTGTFEDETKDKPNFDNFWTCGTDVNYEFGNDQPFIEYGEWIINKDELPQQFQKYAEEISEVFNDNVACC